MQSKHAANYSEVPLLPLSWVRSMQSMTPVNFLKISFNVIHLHLGLSNGLLPSAFPTKTVSTSTFRHICHIPRPSNSFWFDHPNNIWWGIQIMEILIMQSFPLSCSLIPLRDKRLPPHPVGISEHPQPTFLPQCGWPSFTPIQNNRQNYSSTYFNVYTFG